MRASARRTLHWSTSEHLAYVPMIGWGSSSGYNTWKCLGMFTTTAVQFVQRVCVSMCVCLFSGWTCIVNYIQDVCVCEGWLNCLRDKTCLWVWANCILMPVREWWLYSICVWNCILVCECWELLLPTISSKLFFLSRRLILPLITIWTCTRLLSTISPWFYLSFIPLSLEFYFLCPCFIIISLRFN